MARIKKGVSAVINKLKTGITLDVINEPGKINWPVLYCLVKVRNVKLFNLPLARAREFLFLE